MRVNSINNFRMTSFGNENATSPAGETVSTNQIKNDNEPVMKSQPEQDTMQKEHAQEGFRIPTVAEISKMQTTQKIMGGALAGVGLLGIASTFSSKKWVRCLFTVPAGGLLAYVGAKMFTMANSLNKLKAIVSNNPGEQQ